MEEKSTIPIYGSINKHSLTFIVCELSDNESSVDSVITDIDASQNNINKDLSEEMLNIKLSQNDYKGHAKNVTSLEDAANGSLSEAKGNNFNNVIDISQTSDYSVLQKHSSDKSTDCMSRGFGINNSNCIDICNNKIDLPILKMLENEKQKLKPAKQRNTSDCILITNLENAKDASSYLESTKLVGNKCNKTHSTSNNPLKVLNKCRRLSSDTVLSLNTFLDEENSNFKFSLDNRKNSSDLITNLQNTSKTITNFENSLKLSAQLNCEIDDTNASTTTISKVKIPNDSSINNVTTCLNLSSSALLCLSNELPSISDLSNNCNEHVSIPINQDLVLQTEDNEIQIGHIQSVSQKKIIVETTSPSDNVASKLRQVFPTKRTKSKLSEILEDFDLPSKKIFLNKKENSTRNAHTSKLNSARHSSKLKESSDEFIISLCKDSPRNPLSLFSADKSDSSRSTGIETTEASVNNNECCIIPNSPRKSFGDQLCLKTEHELSTVKNVISKSDQGFKKLQVPKVNNFHQNKIADSPVFLQETSIEAASLDNNKTITCKVPNNITTTSKYIKSLTNTNIRMNSPKDGKSSLNDLSHVKYQSPLLKNPPIIEARSAICSNLSFGSNDNDNTSSSCMIGELPLEDIRPNFNDSNTFASKTNFFNNPSCRTNFINNSQKSSSFVRIKPTPICSVSPHQLDSSVTNISTEKLREKLGLLTKRKKDITGETDTIKKRKDIDINTGLKCCEDFYSFTHPDISLACNNFQTLQKIINFLELVKTSKEFLGFFSEIIDALIFEAEQCKLTKSTKIFIVLSEKHTLSALKMCKFVLKSKINTTLTASQLETLYLSINAIEKIIHIIGANLKLNLKVLSDITRGMNRNEILLFIKTFIEYNSLPMPEQNELDAICQKVMQYETVVNDSLNHSVRSNEPNLQGLNNDLEQIIKLPDDNKNNNNNISFSHGQHLIVEEPSSTRDKNEITFKREEVERLVEKFLYFDKSIQEAIKGYLIELSLTPENISYASRLLQMINKLTA